MSVLDQGFTYCHLGLEIDAVYITLQASRYVPLVLLACFRFFTLLPIVLQLFWYIKEFITHTGFYTWFPDINPVSIQSYHQRTLSCSYLGEEETAQYAKLYMWPFYYLGCLRNIAPNCKNGTFWIWLNDTWTSFMSSKS